MRQWLIVIAVLLLPLSVAAQTAYVTDNLRLGLHNAEDTSDRPFQTLESGQEVEILSQNRNYANVSLPDGTRGYVKVAYLVDEKPAKLIVAETQAANEELENKLAELNAAFSQPAATIALLEQQVADSKASVETLTTQSAELAAENAALVSRQSQYKYSVPITWMGGALAVMLLAGFLGGLWWTDYRSRKRHGGIRIY